MFCSPVWMCFVACSFIASSCCNMSIFDHMTSLLVMHCSFKSCLRWAYAVVLMQMMLLHFWPVWMHSDLHYLIGDDVFCNAMGFPAFQAMLLHPNHRIVTAAFVAGIVGFVAGFPWMAMPTLYTNAGSRPLSTRYADAVSSMM